MANPILTIPHPSPLIPGVLLRRYKRFLADVELGDGSLITAHCVNTGRMEGLTMPGLRVWLSHEPSPTRKLAYTWQLTEFPEGLVVGTNTAAPNRIVGELLRRRLLPGLDWDECVPERRYGERSRVDLSRWVWLLSGFRQRARHQTPR
jgi:sugar fermentation stimulation protein A